jgi:GT2 family glycosyltransferase
MNNPIVVSIVLYKTNSQQLKRALNSIIPCRNIKRIDLIDNSPDESLSCFAGLSTKVSYSHTGKNVGFGAGHNISLKQSISSDMKYHLVLNADVYFDPNVIDRLMIFMNTNPDVGLVMPKVFYPNGDIQYLCKLLPTPFDFFLRRFLPNISFFKKSNENFELRGSGYNKLLNVPYLSGCFMFLNVNALAAVGVFDERFFMYPEDIDLSRRIHEKYKTIFYPDAFIFHEHGKASYRSKKMLFVHVVNLIRYFNKWGWFFDDKRKKINRAVIESF